MKLRTTRRVSRKECPWLENDVPMGTIVTRFQGHDYGCVTPVGVPVIIDGFEGFRELPMNALEMHSENIRADRYWAKEYVDTVGDVPIDEAFLTGFNKMKEMATGMCEDLQVPAMKTLLNAIGTAEVDFVTGKPRWDD